jgi:hypothetical protein
MTNSNSISIPIGYTTVTTNADGSTTTTTLVNVRVRWGIDPTPKECLVFALVITSIAFLVFYLYKNKKDSN